MTDINCTPRKKFGASREPERSASTSSERCVNLSLEPPSVESGWAHSSYLSHVEGWRRRQYPGLHRNFTLRGRSHRHLVSNKSYYKFCGSE